MTEDELGRPLMSSTHVLPLYPQLKDRENYIMRKETGGLWQRNDTDESAAIQVRRRLQGSSSVDSGEGYYRVSTAPYFLSGTVPVNYEGTEGLFPVSRPVV